MDAGRKAECEVKDDDGVEEKKRLSLLAKVVQL